MGDELAILLAILLLGYLFLSPAVLLLLYFKQRKTITWLEEELRILKESFQQQRERLANMRQQDMAAVPKPEPPQEPAPPKPEQPVGRPASPKPKLASPKPKIVSPEPPAQPVTPVHPVHEEN